MTKHVWIYIPGIFTVPGRETNWTKRAITYTHLNSGDCAEDFEYFTGPLLRSFGEGERAQKLAKKLAFYAEAGWEMSLVAHSNGADVALDALDLLAVRVAHPPVIRNLHFFSPACHADCTQAGLAPVICRATTVYIADRDRAMQIANTVIGRDLGFGTMGGIDGPQNIEACVSPVHVVHMPDYDHNDWFNTPDRFELTMQMIGARVG